MPNEVKNRSINSPNLFKGDGTAQPISIDYVSHVDHLKRVAFARHLLDIAERIDIEHTSGVVGLEGEWGAGKTRVLLGIEAVIEERPKEARPILIRFNPWMISGTANLVEAFLLQMAADLPRDESRRSWMERITGRGKVAAGLAASLIDYAGILGAVKNVAPVGSILAPGIGQWVVSLLGAAQSAAKSAESAKAGLTRIAQLTDKLSINEAKKKVADQLKQLARKVIILIDDLDRLPPAELVSMLQTVKAVADFPNVVFILAYDPAVAARAVKNVLDLGEDGAAYLEKIIQIPMRLPEPPASRLNAFAADRLRSSIDLRDLPESLTQDLELAWPILAALMTTPRDVERLRTRLMIAVPMLRNEVNAADVAVLEALALKAPAHIDWILNNPLTIGYVGNASRFDENLASRGRVDRSLEVEYPSGIDDSLRHKSFLQDWKDLPVSGLHSPIPVAKAMAFLFDKANSNQRDQKRSGYCRVQCFEFLYQWICYHDHHDPWSKSELDAFLRNPKLITDNNLHRDAASFLQLCNVIWSKGAPSFDKADAVSMVDVFQSVENELGTDLFFNVSHGGIPINLFGLALWKDPDNRVAALNALVDQTTVWLSRDVLNALCKETFSHVEQSNPANQPMFDNANNLQPILEKWFAKAECVFA